MTEPANIPAARVPIIDPKTGYMTREWYLFFSDLVVAIKALTPPPP
jgi:hypothetical protein